MALDICDLKLTHFILQRILFKDELSLTFFKIKEGFRKANYHLANYRGRYFFVTLLLRHGVDGFQAHNIIAREKHIF